MVKFDKESIKFALVAFLFQGCLIILFAFLVDYANIYNPTDSRWTNEAPGSLIYPMFTDVHVMMFVGTNLIFLELALHEIK